MRGDVFVVRTPKDPRGHEQQGRRFCVVVQSDDLYLSTWLVAPTSTSAMPAVFRPEIELDGQKTRVLVEQTATVDPQRLGDAAGALSREELQCVDAALRVALAI